MTKAKRCLPVTLAFLFAGCNAITGLDKDYTEVDCEGGSCGDGSVAESSTNDVTNGHDGSEGSTPADAHEGSTAEGAPPGDAPFDVSETGPATEGGLDAEEGGGAEGGLDAEGLDAETGADAEGGPSAEGGDASDASQCLAPSMICGGVCAACTTPANATPTCSGTTCTFTCDATFTTCGSSCADLQTDASNCGWCGHACGTGSTCSGGTCSPVTVCTQPGTGGNLNIAVQRPGGSVLYWDYFSGTSCLGTCTWDVLSCPTDQAGATPTVVTGGGKHPSEGLWPNGKGSFDYELGTIPTEMGSGGIFRYVSGNTTLLTSIDNLTWTTDFSSGHVFYPDPATPAQLDEIVPEVLTDAGAAEERTCINSLNTLGDWDAAEGVIFAVDSTSEQVFRYADNLSSTFCTSKTQVASGVSNETVLVADSDGAHFYFADDNGVHACAAAGTGCQTLATGQGAVTQLVYDATNVYWTGTTGLVECAKAGCSSAPRVLANNLPTADPIDVDVAAGGTRVYYVQGLSVYSLPK
ncbi:MAG TPA: hypothetical protein VGG39_38045 [Polyangiaceae bacterium]